MKKIVFIVLLLLCSNVVFGQFTTKEFEKVEQNVKELETKIEKIESSKVDKDILDKVYDKEKAIIVKTQDNKNEILDKSYTATISVYQFVVSTVFSIITIIFGGASILLGYGAYFGYTSYQDFKDKKKKFDTEYKDFTRKRDEFDERLVEVERQNSERNEKLKMLELTDKTINALSRKEYEFAMSYIQIILENDNNNISVLSYKVQVLKGLKKYDEAIKTCYTILENIQSESMIFQLAELLLLQDKIEEYEGLKNKYSQYFNDRDLIVVYLHILYLLMKKDNTSLENQYGNIVKSYVSASSLYWDYDLIDEYLALNNLTNNQIKEVKKKVKQHFTIEKFPSKKEIEDLVNEKRNIVPRF